MPLQSGGMEIYMNVIDVVIIGGLHHNTLGVVRSLGEEKISKANLHVLLIDSFAHENNFISHSKYIKKNNVTCIKSNMEIIPWLKEKAHNSLKKVIICCSDGSAEEVINHYDEIKNWYYAPSTVMDASELMSKEIQSKIAVASGLRIPFSAMISSENSDKWSLFPCITKPIKSVIGAGKADIRISKNKTELKETLRSTEADFVQVQQYIDKILEFQLIGCSLDKGNQIIIPGFTDIIRQPDNTNTGYLVYSPIKKLNFDMKPAEEFIKKIGYSGLFSLEFIRDKDGNDYFLEINMRNDGNAYCVKTAGVNLPYVWCYYQVNGTLPINYKLSFEKPIWFMPEFSDIKRGIKSVGFYKWFVEFCKAESHAIFNLHDMAPFFSKIVSYTFRKN